jgi:hypothetical protein
MMEHPSATAGPGFIALISDLAHKVLLAADRAKSALACLMPVQTPE